MTTRLVFQGYSCKLNHLPGYSLRGTITLFLVVLGLNLQIKCRRKHSIVSMATAARFIQVHFIVHSLGSLNTLLSVLLQCIFILKRFIDFFLNKRTGPF